MKIKKVSQGDESLIITSRGGGGHITFSNKISQDLDEKGMKSETVHYVDLLGKSGLKDKIGMLLTRGVAVIFGLFATRNQIEQGIEAFNQAIREGDTEKINSLVSNQPLLDGIKNTSVQTGVTKLLEANGKIKEVHITEVNGILAVLMAVEQENFDRERLMKKIASHRTLSQVDWQKIKRFIEPGETVEQLQAMSHSQLVEAVQIRPIDIHLHITDLLSHRNGYMEGISQAMIYMSQKYRTKPRGVLKKLFRFIRDGYLRICEVVFGIKVDKECQKPTKFFIEYPAVLGNEKLEKYLNDYNQWQRQEGGYREKVWLSREMQGLSASSVFAKRAIKQGCKNQESKSTSCTGFIMKPVPIKALPVDGSFLNRDIIDLPIGLSEKVENGEEIVFSLGSQGRPKDIVRLIKESVGFKRITILAAKGYDDTVQAIRDNFKLSDEEKRLELGQWSKDGQPGWQCRLSDGGFEEVVINVLPMVKPECVSSVYKKADVIQAKAGGVSVMELLAVTENSEHPPRIVFETEGCPEWESLNAECYKEYREKKCDQSHSVSSRLGG